GRPEAYGVLYERNFNRVCRLARRYVRSPEDAEDVAQDTFIKALDAMGRYDPGLGPGFQAWINRICVNCAIDFLRGKKRRTGLGRVSLDALAREPASITPSPEQIVIDRRASSRIHDAVEWLSPRQQMIFTMRYRDQLDIRQIALRLDCSEGNIRAHLFRSTRKLKNHFQPSRRPSGRPVLSDGVRAGGGHE
ncbi:MAG: sigma-70 family RNA polymerase sigma factor, partial [Candidatus Aminicenantales bacterium]